MAQMLHPDSSLILYALFLTILKQGKAPWDTEVRLLIGFNAYLDPNPDNPPAINFGNVAVGSAVDRRAILRNITSVVNTNILVDSLWIKPPTTGVTITSRTFPKDTPIPPGDSLVIGVRYSPTQEEELTSVYVCTRIVEPCLDTICWPLVGKGIASGISASKSSLFMSLPLCAPPNPVYDTVTLTNTGATALSVLRIDASPTSFTRFSPATLPVTLVQEKAST